MTHGSSVDRRSLAAIKGLTYAMFAMFAMTTDSVGLIIPEVIETFTKQIPLGRWADVGDIVGGVLFLCSDLSRYVTGQVLHINGGFFTGSA